MKILHISSFRGNLGDYFNNQSLHSILKKISNNIVVKKLEIRYSYLNYKGKKKWFWDDLELISKSYDKIIIGGGANFELISKKLENFCTINIKNLSETLSSKIIIFSQGFDVKISINTIEKNQFSRYFHFLLNSGIKISLRNDGSIKRLGKFIAKKNLTAIKSTIDCGLINYDKKNTKQNNMVVISPSDQFVKVTDLEIKRLAKIIEGLTLYDLKIILVPHLASDYKIIHKIYSKLSTESKFSNKIRIYYFENSIKFYNQVRSLYANSLFVVSSRFHGLALGISFNKLIYGLFLNSKTESLFLHSSSCKNFLNFNPKNFNKNFYYDFSKTKEVYKIYNSFELKKNTIKYLRTSLYE